MVARVASWSFVALVVVMITAPAHAQSRNPTAPEIAAIRDSVTKSNDDADAGEQQCLFELVADPCIGSPGGASDAVMADCYRIDGEIWGTYETAGNRVAVFETVCDKLGLASCDHKAVQTVAKIIIELEQRGVREPAMLRKMTATLFRRWREAAAVTQCEVTEPRK